MKSNEILEGRRVPLEEIRYSKFEIMESDGEPASISGIISICDAVNANNRLYKTETMARAVAQMAQNLDEHPGLVDHPEGSPSIRDIGIRWTRVYMDGPTVYGEGQIVLTRKGADLEACVRAGVSIGISTRAVASVKRGTWQGQEGVAIIGDDLELLGCDAVVEPSVNGARIQTIESEDDIDYSTLTIESLQEHRPDLVEALTGLETDMEDKEINEAVWQTAQTDTFPNSSFAYIEPGGKLDADGRTVPRSLRHFPYKDADGKPDPAHIRNALARIPQSTLPQAAKDKALAVIKKAAKTAGINVSDAKEHGEEDIMDETKAAEVLDIPIEETVASNTDETKEVTEDSPAESEVTESTDLAEAKAKVEELTASLAETEAKAKTLTEQIDNYKAILAAITAEIGDDLSNNEYDDLGQLGFMAQMAQSLAASEMSEPDDDMMAMGAAVGDALHRVAAANVERYAFSQARVEKNFFSVMESLKSCTSRAEVDAKIAELKDKPVVVEASTKGSISDENVDPVKAKQVATRDRFRGMI